MTYYALRPDIAGQHGEHSVLDTSVHPPRVSHLHVEIDNWAGDDLIKTFPAHLVTEQLGKGLSEAGLRAFELRDVELVIAPEGEEIARELNLPSFPNFQWLDVTGTAGQDDIGITARARLVVSERALDLLHEHRIGRCDIEEYDPAQHGE